MEGLGLLEGPEFVEKDDKGSSEKDKLGVIVCRLNEKLLKSYLSNCNLDPLTVRYHLLWLELEDLRSATNVLATCRRVQLGHNINLLSEKDSRSYYSYSYSRPGPKCTKDFVRRRSRSKLLSRPVPKRVLVKRIEHKLPHLKVIDEEKDQKEEVIEEETLNCSSEKEESAVKLHPKAAKLKQKFPHLNVEYTKSKRKRKRRKEEYEDVESDDISSDDDNDQDYHNGTSESDDDSTTGAPPVKVELLEDGQPIQATLVPEIKRMLKTDQQQKPRGRPPRKNKKKKKKNVNKKNNPNGCDECSFIGTSPEIVELHKQQSHEWKHKSSSSPRKSKSEDDYDDDFIVDNDDDDDDDEYGGDEYKKSSKKNKKFGCDKCSYRTDSETALDSHKEWKHGNKPGIDMVKCSYCDKVMEPRRMEYHMFSKHKEIKMHICDQCPFKTNNLKNLTRHIDNMHLAVNTWPCPECPLQCGSEHALKKHVDRIHRNIQNFMCELCSYRTSTSSELKSHIENKHTAVDRFKCERCEFATANKRQLQRHIGRVHTHIKAFSCPMQGCGYQATEKGDIDKHVKRVHMGMRRYQCHVPRCDFKIDSKSKWLEHLAMEHRFTASEIEEISLKRKRTRIGGASRKAALLQSAPLSAMSSPGGLGLAAQLGFPQTQSHPQINSSS